MKNNNARKIRNPAKRVKKRVVLAAAALFLLYLAGSFGRLHYLNYVERRELGKVHKEQSELNNVRDSLKREKKNLQNIPYLKDYARRKLFLMGEGEIPIRITNAPWDAEPEAGKNVPR